MAKTREIFVVVCIRNAGYRASLELRKIYEVRPDAKAMARGFLRVVDESGEDYLYPATCFAALELSKPLQRALRLAS